MSYLIHENKKHVEKRIAQITIFQIISVLSLPSYAQIVKEVRPSQILMWVGFVLIVALIMCAYMYKMRLKRELVRYSSHQELKDHQKSA